jgi:cytochrome c-type biogenesis protein CcmE
MFVKNKGKMIIGVLAIIMCVSIILFSAQQFVNPYRSVSEVASDDNTLMNQHIQMIGNVVNGSIQTLSQDLTFKISDETSELNVVYSGATPQNFIEGGEVVVSGRLISGYTFEANKILTKCPSKFLQGTG